MNSSAYKLIRKDYAALLMPALLLLFISACLLFFPTYFNLLSGAGILLSAAYLLSFCDKKYLYYLLAFSLPLSTDAAMAGDSAHLQFPSEIFSVLLFFTFSFSILRKSVFKKEHFTHPVSICIFLYTGSLLLASCTSGMPLVSAKASLVKCMYIFNFYFLTLILLQEEKQVWIKALFFYVLAFIPVIVITLCKQAETGFIKDRSGSLVQPFFPDHTMYSACLAMALPFILNMFRIPVEKRRFSKAFIGSVLLLFTAALFLSYCRAAWISVLVGLLILLLLKTGLRSRALFVIIILSAGIVYNNMDDTLSSMRQNRYDSNAKNASLKDQARSITNISTDQSNAERLNRWKCALRMFADKPLTGFGPGTYQFEYLPYQHKEDMTRISVTSPYNIGFGKGGSTHSEYLLALSEGGIFLFAGWAGIVICCIITGCRLYDRDKGDHRTALAAFFGLITYFTHAFFNNFLETDKAAFLVWSSLAVMVFADLERKKSLIKTNSNS